ncbi:hypothetical protein P7K49_022038 [Saguinus oedipus]|uniref:Uncharacterized protein n=1 Tax=Saguinus oedipus TaxID=9490 RepID=A0ABQ9UV75_SAGOE|nr:hypothetical protein P7K49_022038 [Saguinus oedipus]
MRLQMPCQSRARPVGENGPDSPSPTRRPRERRSLRLCLGLETTPHPPKSCSTGFSGKAREGRGAASPARISERHVRWRGLVPAPANRRLRDPEPDQSAAVGAGNCGRARREEGQSGTQQAQPRAPRPGQVRLVAARWVEDKAQVFACLARAWAGTGGKGAPIPSPRRGQCTQAFFGVEAGRWARGCPLVRRDTYQFQAMLACAAEQS